MSFKIYHFSDSDNVLDNKGMLEDLYQVVEYLDSVLTGAEQYGSLLKQGLSEEGWRAEGVLGILPDRKYQYKGFKQGIAIEGNMSAYEYILEGLFRLQIGYSLGRIDAGVLFLNTIRGDKTPYGSTEELLSNEMELLESIITLPVSVVLFDLV
jgi:hypothetical protein